MLAGDSGTVVLGEACSKHWQQYKQFKSVKHYTVLRDETYTPGRYVAGMGNDFGFCG